MKFNKGNVWAIHQICEDVKRGDFGSAYENKDIINDEVISILNMTDEELKESDYKLSNLVDLITIGNVTYNYSTADILPIEDGLYDKLVVQLQRIDYDKFTSGALSPKINTGSDQVKIEKQVDPPTKPFLMMTEKDRAKIEEEYLFPEIIKLNKPFQMNAYNFKPFWHKGTTDSYVTKRSREVEHNYPNLVGTLEKCKYVLNKQASDLGVFLDPNVYIFERDYIARLIGDGTIEPEKEYKMIYTLKYDGVSIEADVTDHIISARTRGDTDLNKASDLTPILGGYKFPNAPNDVELGMKFEAIILKEDLVLLNQLLGTEYINGRTAIIGLLGSSQAAKYRDFITLVPLQVDFSNTDIPTPDRETEIEFLNKYYANREYIRYSTYTGKYTDILFMTKKFTDEAEAIRPYMNFMYDGIVVEFADEKIRQKLGRRNSINQYARAIKFNALSKITIFRGYTYSIGQNGVIVPILHYDPVEFLGSIHTKCSGASYERFRELNLFIGDQMKLSYVNDVMPYPDKMESDFNTRNHMRNPTKDEQFPIYCPSCGTKLELSIKMKTVFCPNIKCGERTLQRITNMFDKLGIKDFSQASIEQLGIKTFRQFMLMTKDDFAILGPTNSIKLYNLRQEVLFNNPLPDYRLIGALGFSNIASKKWKTIFSKYSLVDMMKDYKKEISNGPSLDLYSIRDVIANIKGVGIVTAETIYNEMEFFEKDIDYILQHVPYKATSQEDRPVYKIRFSGFRDRELSAVLNSMENIDCDDDAPVTKDTKILLIPYIGFSSSKTSKAMQYNIPCVPVTQFMQSPSKYIPGLEEVSKF